MKKLIGIIFVGIMYVTLLVFVTSCGAYHTCPTYSVRNTVTKVSVNKDRIYNPVYAKRRSN